jgi:hypothetical protein
VTHSLKKELYKASLELFALLSPKIADIEEYKPEYETETNSESDDKV